MCAGACVVCVAEAERACERSEREWRRRGQRGCSCSKTASTSGGSSNGSRRNLAWSSLVKSGGAGGGRPAYRTALLGRTACDRGRRRSRECSSSLQRTVGGDARQRAAPCKPTYPTRPSARRGSLCRRRRSGKATLGAGCAAPRGTLDVHSAHDQNCAAAAAARAATRVLAVGGLARAHPPAREGHEHAASPIGLGHLYMGNTQRLPHTPLARLRKPTPAAIAN
jgi:hypothetical protein